MRAVLEINGFDIIPYLAEEGIDYGTVKRVTRTVTTLDGREHRSSVTKNSLSLKLLDMSDDQLAEIEHYLDQAAFGISTVNYTDRHGGLHTNSQFYVDPPQATGKQTIGGTNNIPGAGITYLTGITIEMEEV